MFTAEGLYGSAPVTQSVGTAAPTQSMAVTGHDIGDGWKSLLSLQNPLTWFAGFLLVTVGAAGISGSARLGKAKVTGSVGS